MENNNQNNNSQNNSDKLKWAACFIPFLWWIIAVVLYFTEVNKSKGLSKNISYSIFLLIAYIILRLLFITFFLTWWWFGGLLWLAYFIACVIFFIKVFKWEDIQVDAIDNVIWTANNTVKRSNFNNNTQNQSTNTNNESTASKIINKVVNNTGKKDEFEELDENEIKTNNIVVDKMANGFASMVSKVKKEQKDEFEELDEEVTSDESVKTKKEENNKNEDILDF